METDIMATFDHREESDSPPTLRLRIPPDPLLGRMVRLEILNYARRNAIEADLGDFIFAIGEALANAFAHATKTHTIDIDCSLDNDKLFVTVKDYGPGMRGTPTSEFPEPDALTERGRGIPIMGHCSDLLSVNSTPGMGTEVVLARHVKVRRT
jgi:serine/threonine-protein kinase RsbW